MQEVAIGIVVKDTKVLIIEKKNPKGHPIWRFPGGKVENNESIEEAIVREVEEETGILCLPLAEIATRNWLSKNMKLRFFLCQYIRGINKVNEPEIFNAVQWVTPDLAEKLIGKNAKIQIKNFLNWLIEGKLMFAKNNSQMSPVLEYVKDFQHIDTVVPLPSATYQLEKIE